MRMRKQVYVAPDPSRMDPPLEAPSASNVVEVEFCRGTSLLKTAKSDTVPAEDRVIRRHGWRPQRSAPCLRGPIFTAEEVYAVQGSVAQKILARMHGPQWGHTFIRTDFSGLGDSSNVRTSLAKLTAEGLIRRVERKWYNGNVSVELRDKIRAFVFPTPTMTDQVLARINAAPPGRVFRAEDFADFAEVNRSCGILSHLARHKLVVRVAFGQYMALGSGTAPARREPFSYRLVERINAAPQQIFHVSDFADIADSLHCRGLLASLVRRKIIRRLGRGEFVALAYEPPISARRGALKLRLLERINGAPDRVFSVGDFADLSGDLLIRSNLSRLTKSGHIRRVAWGGYTAAGSPPPTAATQALPQTEPLDESNI